MSEYRFAWVGSGMGWVSWHVFGDGERYEVETWAPSPLSVDYFRGNVAADVWKREFEGCRGKLKRAHYSTRPIAQGVVDAFNAWRLAQHREWIAKILGDPERYGKIAADDPILVKPAKLEGARYVVGHGWVTNETAAEMVA